MRKTTLFFIIILVIAGGGLAASQNSRNAALTGVVNPTRKVRWKGYW